MAYMKRTFCHSRDGAFVDMVESRFCFVIYFCRLSLKTVPEMSQRPIVIYGNDSVWNTCQITWFQQCSLSVSDNSFKTN